MSSQVRTFVLTDLVGSTELWDTDPENMAVALEAHDELLAGVVKDAGGKLVQTKGEGDSTFSVFVHPAAGVDAARRIVAARPSSAWLASPRGAATSTRLVTLPIAPSPPTGEPAMGGSSSVR